MKSCSRSLVVYWVPHKSTGQRHGCDTYVFNRRKSICWKSPTRKEEERVYVFPFSSLVLTSVTPFLNLLLLVFSTYVYKPCPYLNPVRSPFLPDIRHLGPHWSSEQTTGPPGFTLPSCCPEFLFSTYHPRRILKDRVSHLNKCILTLDNVRVFFSSVPLLPDASIWLTLNPSPKTVNVALKPVTLIGNFHNRISKRPNPIVTDRPSWQDSYCTLLHTPCYEPWVTFDQ